MVNAAMQDGSPLHQLAMLQTQQKNLWGKPSLVRPGGNIDNCDCTRKPAEDPGACTMQILRAGTCILMSARAMPCSLKGPILQICTTAQGNGNTINLLVPSRRAVPPPVFKLLQDHYYAEAQVKTLPSEARWQVPPATECASTGHCAAHPCLGAPPKNLYGKGNQRKPLNTAASPRAPQSLAAGISGMYVPLTRLSAGNGTM